MRKIREVADELDRLATTLRRVAVVHLRDDGKTFQEIGDELGIVRQHAHELYTQAQQAKANAR